MKSEHILTPNPQYDRLLLSASSDSNVALWSLGGLREGEAGENGLVSVYDGSHNDSVYAACWANTQKESFVFASLSFDGRVAVNQAPSEARYESML